jgi:hypothetical protein
LIALEEEELSNGDCVGSRQHVIMYLPAISKRESMEENYF